jgi:integrase/recombinase XerD
VALMPLRQLDHDIAGFLAFKRARGHPYQRGAFMLRSLGRYAAGHVDARRRVDLDRVMRGWLARAEGRKPVTVTVELGVLRQFCLFRRRSDPRALVPGRDWAPQAAVSMFLPHILAPADIRQLLREATRWRGPHLRAVTLRTLLIILYCTGLRPGEAVRLDVGDVDLDQLSFRIRESKGKTRLVPFGDDLAEVVRRYLQERARVSPVSAAGPLLVRPDGRGLSPSTAGAWLARLFRRVGLKPAAGRCGPRPYDVRHTFAVHRLTAWYRAGVDVHARFPWLSAYMGHDDLLGTEAYLTATPELMALAGSRFARRFRMAEAGR